MKSYIEIINEGEGDIPKPLAADGDMEDNVSNDTNDVLSNISTVLTGSIETLTKLEQDINDTEIPSDKLKDIIAGLTTYLEEINGEGVISQFSNQLNN